MFRIPYVETQVRSLHARECIATADKCRLSRDETRVSDLGPTGSDGPTGQTTNKGGARETNKKEERPRRPDREYSRNRAAVGGPSFLW